MLQPMNPAPPVTRTGRESGVSMRSSRLMRQLPSCWGPCSSSRRRPGSRGVKGAPLQASRGPGLRRGCGTGPPSSDQPPCLELGSRLVDAVVGGLDGDPFGELGEALLEILFGPEAEPLRGFRRVAEAMADVADPALADDLRIDVVAAHCPGELGRHLGDRAVVARADVEHLADRLGKLERLGEGPGDVPDIDEVAALAAVLEDHRLLAVEEPRGEDGE